MAAASRAGEGLSVRSAVVRRLPEGRHRVVQSTAIWRGRLQVAGGGGRVQQRVGVPERRGSVWCVVVCREAVRRCCVRGGETVWMVGVGGGQVLRLREAAGRCGSQCF